MAFSRPPAPKPALTRPRRAVFVAAALAVATCAVAGVGRAQSTPSPDKILAAEPPLPLDGTWFMLGHRSSQLYTAAQRAAVTVDGKLPPLTPEAKKLFDQRIEDADKGGLLYANNAARCVPQGLPFMPFAQVDGPIQVIVKKDQVTIITTELSERWLIYMQSKHADDLDNNEYHGDSIGRWEGDTLVVDTIGVSGDKTTIDQVGMPHSDDMHLVTRIRQTDKDTLEMLMTVDDPKTFTRPWDQKVVYKRAAPDQRITDWACENQRNAPGANGFQSISGINQNR